MKNIIFLLMVIFAMSCGVKKPPRPLYSTPLPFEEDPDTIHAKSSASPVTSHSPIPSPSPGKRR